MIDKVKPEDIGKERKIAFISYSHKDKKWLERLDKYLKPYNIDLWDDTQIKAGQVWRIEIIKALNSAKVAIFLVSQDFLDSEFIQKHELSPLLEEAQKGGVTLLWIAVRPSTYEQSEFEKYQALNNPEKPLTSLGAADCERELCEICKKISARYKCP
jgi:internalin A